MLKISIPISKEEKEKNELKRKIKVLEFELNKTRDELDIAKNELNKTKIKLDKVDDLELKIGNLEKKMSLK